MQRQMTNKEGEPKPAPLTLERITAMAKEMLLRNGAHIPTVLVEGVRNTAAIQIQDLEDTSAKRHIQLAEAGFMLAKTGQLGSLRQVFYVGEGWMGREMTKGTAPAIKPSEDPERKEVLLIFSIHVETQEKSLTVFEMLRTGDGQSVDLIELERTQRAESFILEAFVLGYEMGMDTTGN